jgi:orotidine-5'-phosphate decarboxylase
VIAKNQIVLALDCETGREATTAAKSFAGSGVRFKVGMELFNAEGPAVVGKIAAYGPVFLDLKLHDIPITMARTATVLTKLGVWMFNVHASAGPEALRRVREATDQAAAKAGIEAPLVVGVTLLTSLTDLTHLGSTRLAQEIVLELARLTHAAGLDGVVCAAPDVRCVKTIEPGFLCVTPGIRGPQDPPDDQRRTLSAPEAVAQGSDYLVIGRPILRAPDPLKALEHICASSDRPGG